MGTQAFLYEFIEHSGMFDYLAQHPANPAECGTSRFIHFDH